MVDDELAYTPNEGYEIQDSCEDLPAQNVPSSVETDPRIVGDKEVDESCPICGLFFYDLKDSVSIASPSSAYAHIENTSGHRRTCQQLSRLLQYTFR